ncbi:Uncharacterised protein [Citrobacter amalonaticus]|nr:Uncharacterised protein [Citrobacter amalonaticus]
MLIRVEIPIDAPALMPCCVVHSKAMRKRNWFTTYVKMVF